MGTEDLGGKGQFQGRWSEAEGDLRGQQQFTQQVAPRQQGFTGEREKYFLCLLGNERLLALTAMTQGGEWEQMDLQQATPLLWRSQTDQHWGPSPSQRGCGWLLHGHSTLRVISAGPCPATTPRQNSEARIGGQSLQGGYK